MKPRLALTLGDPTGIGPELIAKLLADPATMSSADIVVIGSRSEFERGQLIAGVEIECQPIEAIEDADYGCGKPAFLDVPCEHSDLPHGRVSAEAGRHCLDVFGVALDLAAAGTIDALCFAPLNKEALHKGGNPFEDELHWFANRLGVNGFISEVNVLDGVWTSRVSSHIPMRLAAKHVTAERVDAAIALIVAMMRAAGQDEPRVVVCGFNPHAGEGGLLGFEEIETIQPAVLRARGRGYQADGPFPADTVFLRVRRGDYDAVVTMYHDQGQIALKLLGFERGVTIQGGLPIPITTPSHGTAFDIAGQNKANVSTTRHAFEMACRLGSYARPDRVTT